MALRELSCGHANQTWYSSSSIRALPPFEKIGVPNANLWLREGRALCVGTGVKCGFIQRGVARSRVASWLYVYDTEIGFPFYLFRSIVDC